MQPAYPAYPVSPRPQRPLGITILAILYFLAGVLLFLLGLLVIIGALLIESAGPAGLRGLGAMVAMVGGLVFFMGVLGMAVGWGLWSLRPWARTLALIFTILALILSLLSVAGGDLTAIVGLAMGLLVLWYLFRPEVKAAFGVAPVPIPQAYGYLPPQGFAAPPAYLGAPPMTPTVYCPQCGMAVLQGSMNCPSCGSNLS